MPDFKDVYREATAAALAKLESRAPETGESLHDIANAHKPSLRALLSSFADGAIDEATLESQLAHEKLAFQRELVALEAVTRKAARDAAKAFMDVIERAGTTALEGLL